jgi:hypothetical protein
LAYRQGGDKEEFDMRKLLSVLIAGALLGGAASTAGAAVLNWEGQLAIQLGSLLPVIITGQGYGPYGAANVNGTGGTGHLSTLNIPQWIGGSGVVKAAIQGTGKVPVTDPNAAPLLELRGTITLGSGTLTGMSAGGGGLIMRAPLAAVSGTGVGTMPVQGLFKMCILFGGCGSFIPVPMTQNGTKGVGIGGLMTVNGYGAGIQISVVGAPWTVATAVITGIPTANGGFETSTAFGFAHGPASATSSTAMPGGVIQLVSPNLTITSLGTGTVVGLFSTLTIQFVPEPGTFLLFGAGVAALGVVGRRRRK